MTRARQKIRGRSGKPRRANVSTVTRTPVPARLIGGQGDGWVTPVDGSAHRVFVTMLQGRPRTFSTFDADTRSVIDQAEGRWDFYEPIQHLPPDPRGRRGYWVTQTLRPGGPDPDVALDHDVLDTIETTLSRTGADQAWAVLEQLLRQAGHELAEPRELPT